MPATIKSTRDLTFGEATKRFTDAGIPAKALLPVAPPGAPVCEKSPLARDLNALGKKQGRFDARRAKWTGLGGYAVTNGLDKRTQAEALDWPTGNVAVLGRLLPGIDVDAGSETFSRLAYQALIETFEDDDGDNDSESFAERYRGDTLSRTYSFRAHDPNDPIRTRRLKIRMPGDDPNAKARHGVDIQGIGAYYLIAGTHPSLDEYHWNPDRDLAEMHRDNRLLSITNGDIDRFLKRLTELVEAAGGEVVHASGASAGGGGKRRDYGFEEPIAPPQQIVDALNEFPNTEANLPLRGDLVKALAATRAALGLHAPEVEWANKVRDWACADETWCPDDYFDQIWNSLDRGVDCPQDKLPRLLRDLGGVRSLDGAMTRREFPDDAPAVSREISGHKAAEKDAKAAENAPLLARAARAYVFQHMGTATGAASRNIRQPMRLRAHPERVWSATEWWDGKTTDPNTELLHELHVAYPKKTGLHDFLRDLNRINPFAFFIKEIRHPGFDYGEVVKRYDTREVPAGALNVQQRSQAQNVANKPRRNPALAQADTDHFLDFMKRGFGDGRVTEYLLDTLAYMVQRGKRPGHMLVIEGDQKVGKSLFAEFLIALFDGNGDHVRSRIDGAKLMNEAALRFLFGQIEGCRICSIKELPEGSGRATTAALISTVKQMVDAGSGGDFIDVEKKGVDSRSIENHCYIIATTNYENVIPLEEQNRRILVARFRITRANRPAEEYYARLGAIMADPERLAAIWEHLAAREIGRYRASDNPPVTAEGASYQLRALPSPVRHMAVAIHTLAQAGRGFVTMSDIVRLMNWAARIEDGEEGGWDDGGGDTYRVGKPVGASSIGPSPVRGKALEWLGDNSRKVTPQNFRGKRPPTVYVLPGCSVPIEDMPWPELSAAIENDRRNHPIREGVRAKPYDVPIEAMPPVVDRLAGEIEDYGADDANRANVVPIEGRRRA